MSSINNIRPVQQYDDLFKTKFHMSVEVNYEDITLIWADENLNENFDCLDTKCRLNIIVNYFKAFTDPQETIDYIQSAKNEHIFLIVSGSLGELVLSQIINEIQIKFIYIFCINKDKYDAELADKYDKISGIFVDKDKLFQHLTSTVRTYEKNLMTMSLFDRILDTTEEQSIRHYMIENDINLEWLEAFFDILLHLPIDANLAKQDMIAECRLYYSNNLRELQRIDEFEKTYSFETVLHWYTRDSFVYRLVNKALRTLNVDIIFKFRFLIIDIYQQLKQRHTDYIKSLSTSNPAKIIRRVYRSQFMRIKEIEKLHTCIGQLICPNTFFSTSETFLLAQGFIAGGSSFECVTFQIDIPESYYQIVNEQLDYTRPFYKLDNLSQFESENEVIFSMGTLFRIVSVEKFHIYFVCLKLETENDISSKCFYISNQLENISQNWQNRCNVEDRILLLTEKLPEKCKSLVIVYIKYGVFANEEGITTMETLTTYRKGFELIMKCLPDYQHTITIAMYLSLGLLYCYKGERILALEFGDAALQIAQTYLKDDADYCLVCYNYLAVIHQMEDQYIEALSIYEKMLSIANDYNHLSALLAIYKELSRVTSDLEDTEYEFVCLTKIAELETKLNCERKTAINYEFACFYKKQKNFLLGLYYYKRYFRYLLQENTHINDLTKSYVWIGNMYENLKYYSAAIRIYMHILLFKIRSLPFYNHSMIWKYKTVLGYLQRLLSFMDLTRVKSYFQSLISRTVSSKFDIKFINKLKFLYYFKFHNPVELKSSLQILFKQTLKEYYNQKAYEKSMKKLYQFIHRFLKNKPLCFAKIYHNAQELRKFQSLLVDLRQHLYLIQRSFFNTCYITFYKAQEINSIMEKYATDIGRAIHGFTHSSHTTLCHDRIQHKIHRYPRSLWIYQYRFCRCYKNPLMKRRRPTSHWVKFSRL